MPISWQMMLSTSAMRARREAPPPKTESATLETTLKEGALDAGAGGSCCDAPTAGRCFLSATGWRARQSRCPRALH
mgnify:CR=1 FL=1